MMQLTGSSKSAKKRRQPFLNAQLNQTRVDKLDDLRNSRPANRRGPKSAQNGLRTIPHHNPNPRSITQSASGYYYYNNITKTQSVLSEGNKMDEKPSSEPTRR